MWLLIKDEREAVQGVISAVHEHLDVLQDACGEVLCLINGQEEGLLVFVEIEILDLARHGTCRAFRPSSPPPDRTQLALELHDTGR